MINAHKLKAVDSVVNERPLTFETARYGMMVEVLNEHDSGYHAGCKIHFFNKKGALVGNYYEFLPYNRLRLRDHPDRYYPRFFMGKNYLKKNVPLEEKVKTWLFIRVCNIVGGLIKFTQKYID